MRARLLPRRVPGLSAPFPGRPWRTHDRLRRLRRLGRRALDQPAPPDGRLAANNRVLFVESLGLRRPQLAGRDLRRMARRLVARIARATRDVRDGASRSLAAGAPAHCQPAGARSTRVPAAARWVAPRAGRVADARCSGPTCRRPRCCSTSCAPDRRLPLRRRHRRQKGIDAASLPRGGGALRRAAPTSSFASSPPLAERMRPLAGTFTPPTSPTPLCSPTARRPGAGRSALAAVPGRASCLPERSLRTKLDVDLLARPRARPPRLDPRAGRPGRLGDPSTDVSALGARQRPSASARALR